jgi:preprotein translocase subunit SecG
MTFFYFFSITLFLLLCVLLCGVILIQDSKGSGLGSSFGGEASSSLFGTSTAGVLKRFTGWLIAIFLISCVFLSLWTTALGRTKTIAPNFTMEHIEE